MENNNTLSMDYEAAMNNLENNIQDGLANIPEMPELPVVNTCTKNNVASGILLGVAGVGTVAIVGWAVYGGIKLGKFIKNKAAAKKKGKADIDEFHEFYDDDIIEDVADEAEEA